ncbi:hypothetical protein [Aldersonia sp. NBC_00410]|uniref:hypothetical protein n=1 Tax=Aldersonia sp. NBC_00410 TaxID=2975954 RepID=UPI00224F5FCA|nr:hypothetical protein [Aldersonia sp. NBC_00410]
MIKIISAAIAIGATFAVSALNSGTAHADARFNMLHAQVTYVAQHESYNLFNQFTPGGWYFVTPVRTDGSEGATIKFDVRDADGVGGTDRQDIWLTEEFSAVRVWTPDHLAISASCDMLKRKSSGDGAARQTYDVQYWSGAETNPRAQAAYCAGPLGGSEQEALW